MLSKIRFSGTTIRQNTIRILELLTDGTIEKQDYASQRTKIDEELKALQEEYKEIQKASECNQPQAEICWDAIMEVLNQIADPNGDQTEIVQKLVSRIVPDGKWKFRWYLNLDGENETALDVVVEGKKNHAIVNINNEGSETQAPLPLHKGEKITLDDLKNDKKSSLMTILHRQLYVRSRHN